MSLTNKQKTFAEAYLLHFNATRAAKEAGYSEDSAASIGHENLKKPEIASYIRTRMNEAAMTVDEVLFHLAQIARGDLTDILDRNGNPDLELARRLGKSNLIRRVKNRSITTEQSDITEGEAEGYDRLKALEMIGKFHAMFTDKVRVDDWRSDAIEAIQRGETTYEELLEKFPDEPTLADELFQEAGVKIARS